MHAQWHVILVHVDRHAELASRALREPDVVEVRVREDDRLDLVRAAPELPQGAVERVPGGWYAGVHDRDRPVVLDEVPVGVRVLDAVDAVRDMWNQHLASSPGGGLPPRHG